MNADGGAALERARAIVGRRARMGIALGLLPLAQREHAALMDVWLLAQPAEVGREGGDPADFWVSVAGDLRRVRWAAAGARGGFIPAMAELFEGLGALGSELERLAEAGAALEPDLVGSWMELTAEGIDLGWVFPAALPLAEVQRLALGGEGADALGRWAAEFGVQTCVSLGRSVVEGLVASELLLPLPTADPQSQLAAARELFSATGSPWIGEDVARALAATGSDAMSLAVAVTREGLSRIGVALPDPSTELVLSLTAAMGSDYDDALAGFEGALGVDGPQLLVVGQRADGFEVELSYAL